MVNAERVKRKLPSLLCNGPSTKRQHWNSFMRYRYQLQQFKKHNPQRIFTLTNELISVLEKIDAEVK